MVISAYRKIGDDANWYCGELLGVDKIIIKIRNQGPWLTVIDNSDGTYKLIETQYGQHEQRGKD